MTMTLVSTVTVGSGGAANIEWTSIPQTATDILITLSSRSSLGDGVTVEINGSSTGFVWKRLYGSGTAAFSSGDSTNDFGAASNSSGKTADTFASTQIYIPNYTSSIAKSISSDQVGENNATSSYQQIRAMSWSGTSAITSIKLISEATFVQYSTASLYTITKGSGGASVA